jgi:hypothetical protein
VSTPHEMGPCHSDPARPLRQPAHEMFFQTSREPITPRGRKDDWGRAGERVHKLLLHLWVSEV